MNGNNKESFFSVKSVSSVIRFLIISDFFMWGSWGLIYPIFAIYITDSISGAGLEVAGIAYGILIFVRSIFQIPVAILADKMKGEKDDYWFMVAGSVFLITTPIFLIFIDQIWQLYLVQAFHGLANALIYPARMAVFTRHIDREHEGLEWGIYRTLMDIGTALASFIGGFIVATYSWSALMAVRSLLYLIGTIFVLGIYKQMKKGKVLFSRK